MIKRRTKSSRVKSKPTVVVGLSGGVDSSVAALLLSQQGYQVEAVFMQNWHEEAMPSGCTSRQDLQDVQAVCEQLKIGLHLVDFSQNYWQEVFENFLNEYAQGRTPNPDVLCNREIKFGKLLSYVQQELGADYLATGHYARVAKTEAGYQLLRGLDRNKDQSYFLYLLKQRQLAKVIFPLGELTKQEVRRIAAAVGLVTSQKKESMGICFIGERKFNQFLGQYLLARPGAIVTRSGTQLGRHRGLMFYTIGQRRGLGIGGQQDHKEAPWYVAAKNSKTNELIVTQNRDDSALAARKLLCHRIHWLARLAPSYPYSCTAKIRYRQVDTSCVIYQQINRSRVQFLVEFATPQWAITPGQSIVFYQGEECLGGAIIAEALAGETS